VNESEKKIFHVHLVSDATGETINSIARACLVQFENIQVQEHFWGLIRTKRQMDLVFEGLRQWPGLVLYTFVDESLRRILSDYCAKERLPSHSVLEPILSIMSATFGMPSAHDPGRQHVLDADYFARIEAMDYALSLDDGNKTEKLDDADVIILGVSRTSKTPTCIYLSHRGIRAANVPIVPGIPLDIDFSLLQKPLIVGLTKDPESLVETRLNRLRLLNDNAQTPYTNIEKVREEVLEARRLFGKLGCPVIDVSRRSIEETAAEIMMLLNKRSLEKEIVKQAQTQTQGGPP
jgi:regulator of PEP synthase PpsR (kinase-PPPase family)